MKLDEKARGLAADFAESVTMQTEAIRRGDHRLGNKFAKRYIMAFKKLRSIGDPGREALVPLLDHSRDDVREMAAAFLLRYRTDAALKVLQEIALKSGLAAFGASEAIKRWNEGSWNLDPP